MIFHPPRCDAIFCRVNRPRSPNTQIESSVRFSAGTLTGALVECGVVEGKSQTVLPLHSVNETLALPALPGQDLITPDISSSHPNLFPNGEKGFSLATTFLYLNLLPSPACGRGLG